MLIYVDAASGRTTGVSLRPSDTVADLKVRIEDEEWIPQDKQCLTFGNDKLEDGHTLESYGIGEGATIHLSRPDYAENDEAYRIYVQCTEEEGTEEEGKEEEGKEEEGTEEEGKEEGFPVWIKASDTIGSLKARLMNSIAFHGPWRGQHHLIFNQQQLEDGYKFSDYNIQESTIISFRCQGVFLISITATSDKRQRLGIGDSEVERIQLEVTGGETISSLKARLWDEGLISQSEQQYLIYNGMYLANRRTLSDYNIQEDATIYRIDKAFPIQIRYQTGEKIRIFVEGTGTIGDMKSRLQVQLWIPRDMQMLIFGGQQLEDKKLVFDYNILEGSTVDLQLPRRMDAPLSYWTAGSIQICIKTPTGKNITILAKGHDTIENVKSRIYNKEDISVDRQRLIFAGKQFKDEWIISDYTIREGSTFHLNLRLLGGGVPDRTKKIGLDNIAQAISLWDWDGIMPGPGNNATGLRLSKGDVITIGRIVNDEWYQGFKDKGICGYFPRAFVSVRKIEKSEFKDDIRVDDTPIEELQVHVTDQEPIVKAPRKLLTSFRHWRPFTGREVPNRQRPKRIISKLFPLTPLPPDPNRPDLPPSPVPAPPYDEIVDGNRVLVQFSLDPKDNQRNYTLRATLSLNSAPDARFSGLTFKVDMADGTILAISPENVVGPETEAEVTKDKNFQTSLSASLQAGGASLSASIGASASITRAEHITSIRKTRGTVQGNGVGSSRAYWVMKEDNGPAAEQGLGPIFDLMVKLNVRPAIFSFEVMAHILCEGGGMKYIKSGILGTSV